MMSFYHDRLRTLLQSGLVSGLALLLTLATGVNIAAAHSELAESNPVNGALLDEPPEVVWLRFTEELETGSSLDVFDQDGQQVDLGDGGLDLNDLDHQRMVVSLPSSLANGTYTARWTAVSAEDGDTTNGAISFTVGGSAVAGEVSPAGTSSGLSLPLLLAAFIVVVLVVAGAVTIGQKRRVREGVK